MVYIYVIGREARDYPSSLHTRPCGSERPKKCGRMKILHVVFLGIKWIIFCGLPDIALGSLEIGGSNAKLGLVANNLIGIDYYKYLLPWCGHGLPNFWECLLNMLRYLNMVRFHFAPWSLRPYQLWNWISPSHGKAFLDGFQGPLDSRGHKSWSMCKAALNWDESSSDL